ncbi:MAG: rod shape-determining protein MreD [Coriobacteriaceae bacterium]|uniref:rod shape-determining protein MreD n=1 Tax=Tractidigestivibacter sp. TaxID=2847320 RepID=UPI002A91773E|nr:rod shape-determining protein MreD [Tractidigestivibacter sp.]MCI6273630.1 rod shape-determining protein MreD [Coriobacteriaceae bacterium]MCI6843176.1 rod shape-determining protein MreD [Coriobacteriaceae bacterium]MDD7584062.1 rod shape-determining protein MreD [Coriobacteriaceae bacterium]MDY5270999.1 rod shape-determining protein MreD [Tractidigestivibacter sp.]
MQVADKNRNRRDILVLALVCGVCQLALAPNIGIGNGRANLALVFTACVAFNVGGRTGVLAGFLAGLFFDLSTTGPIGLMAGCCAAAAYAMGQEGRGRMAGELGASVVEFSVAALVVSLVYHAAMLMVGQSSSLLDAVALRALPTALLTIVSFLPFAWFYSRSTGGGPSLSMGGRRRGGGSHLSTRGL